MDESTETDKLWAVQSLKAVTANFSSKQLLPFGLQSIDCVTEPSRDVAGLLYQ